MSNSAAGQSSSVVVAGQPSACISRQASARLSPLARTPATASPCRVLVNLPNALLNAVIDVNRPYGLLRARGTLFPCAGMPRGLYVHGSTGVDRRHADNTCSAKSDLGISATRKVVSRHDCCQPVIVHFPALRSAPA